MDNMSGLFSLDVYGCGTVDREVTSTTRGSGFESSQWQLF